MAALTTKCSKFVRSFIFHKIPLHCRFLAPKSVDTQLSTFSTKSEDANVSQQFQGFLKAQERLEHIILNDIPNEPTDSEKQKGANESFKDLFEARKHKKFAELYRESPNVRLGDFSGQLVIGKIVTRVNEEIYIDYGGKFNCMCKVPQKFEYSDGNSSNSAYQEGKEVVLEVRDHEMTARFMGYDKDMTLLEADARLVASLDKSKPKKKHIL